MKPVLNAGIQLSRFHKLANRITNIRLAGLCVLCLFNSFHFASVDAAQSNSSGGSVEWRTGKALDKYLGQTLIATWVEAPIKARLSAFSQGQRVAIILDRRIDPGTKVDISMSNVTLELFLTEIARQNDWGVCRLDDSFYVGPKSTTCRLPIVWKQMKSESSKRRRAFKVDWGAVDTFELPELSAPKAILTDLATKHGFTITDLDVPHDLWSATELPNVSLDGQVALLLVGFNKWFERSDNGEAITLVDFPLIKTGKYEFPPAQNAKDIHRELRKKFPDCRISIRGKSIAASGDPSQLAEIYEAFVRMNQPQTSPNDAGAKVFTMTARGSRIAILKRIAQNTNNQLIFPPELAEVLNEQIELSLNDASLNDLLDIVLRDTGLSFQVGGDRLEINK